MILFTYTIEAQSPEDLVRIYRYTNRKKLSEMGNQLSAQAEVSRRLAFKTAKEKGWFSRKESDDGRIIELKGLDRSGKPVYFSTANLNAAITVSADKTWAGGSLGLNLSGNGVILREWDAGEVRPTHVELVNRTVMGDGATNLADHSTHIAGTMLATGIVANAHGMSNQATLRAFDWYNDYAEMTTEAANGALLSNHSYIYQTGWLYYGSSWYWYGDPTISETTDYLYGFYMSDAATVDQIAYNAPYYLVCKAVGNDRLGGPASQPVPNYAWINNAWVLTNTVRDLNGGPDGWDCISSGFGVSKNIMSVGAVYSIPGGYTNPADVVFASFSGTGPTDDGRIKPDIVADGIGLYSTLSGGNTSYGSMSGTSMATPNVTGSLGLLQEHYHNLHGTYMFSSTLRGLAIHTANEAGPSPGPDYKFGWGLLNIAGAASALSQLCNTLVLEDTLINGSTLSFSLNAKGTEPLVATLCWTDPPGTPPPPSLNPPTLMLVNDLDMRIDGSAYKPYVLDPANVTAAATTGDNFRDNVEKIYIPNPPTGNHILTITHKNTLTNGMQAFSLIITGLNTSLIAGSVGSNQTICANGSPLQLSGIPPSGAIRPYIYQWQSSTDNLNFVNMPGANNLNYQPGPLTSTTYYRMTQASSGGCGSVFTNTIAITVLPLPIPAISGPATSCLNSTTNVYETQAGMTGYTWVVSAGGSITSGAGTNSVTVTWHTVGARTISVSYTNANGCTASSATVYNVTVNPLPVPAITGPATSCLNSTTNVYTTQAGMTGYTWVVSAGGIITSGAGTNSVTVTWNTAGIHTVSVNYVNAYGCTASAAVVYNVMVNPLPVPAITGPSTCCLNSTTNVYTTLTGMTGYTWVVSAGGTITSGAGTNSVTVTWNTLGAATISVNYTNANGCTASAAAVYNVTVNSLPAADFSANNLTPALNTTVTFTDLSTGGATTWSWVFTPSTVTFVGGTTASSQNPQVQFTAGGLYTVALTVTTATCPNTMTKTGYIRAGTPGTWTGLTSTDWATGSNWQDYLVPTPLINITIPPGVPNWPTATGNLSIGGSLGLTAASCNLTVTGNLTLLSGSSVNNLGTISLQGNLVNQNVGVTNLGTGTFTLNGITTQNVSGLHIFGNLTLNNASGFTLGNDQMVNGILTLTSGRLTLGTSHLTLGTAATIAGTPSAAKMVVATGSGEMRKIFSASGSFTFPVGDNTLTAKYSPATLNFTSGTFAPGAYAAVTLSAAKYPGDTNTLAYVKRYWNLSQNGITSFLCNATFNYLASDVVGNESLIYCSRFVPSPSQTYEPANTILHQLTALSLTSVGAFGGSIVYTPLTLTVYLEGLYAGGGVMNNAYAFDGVNFTPRWGALVADRITIEIHDPVTYATIIKVIGNVDLGTNGSALVKIPSLKNGNYYITVKHRNSIETVCGTTQAFTGGAISYNFSDAATKAFGSNMKAMGAGVFAIYVGDVTDFLNPYPGTPVQDGIIDILDLYYVYPSYLAGDLGYMSVDLNGDGVVDIHDLYLCYPNYLLGIYARTP
ncbi:MAG: S8 family serine peptidase [Bacteroidota bacterium]